MLDKLSSSLKGTLQKIANAVFVNDKLINELIKDIQRALLQSDVNVKLVFSLTKDIKDRALKEDPPKGLTKKEHIINIVYEELVKFLGGEKFDISLKGKPSKIMLIGLFGSGKTTSSGKLAKYYSKRGFKVALVGLDVHRPAAMDQIKQIAESIKVPVYINKELKDPVVIWKKIESELAKYDLVIIDTAGRDALSDDLIAEIKELNELINPNERLLVISADIGQAAQKQAETFHEALAITGVITTKMDGTAKAGGALTACAVTKAPIKFIGIGESSDDLEPFNPKGFVGRLLGMGDLEALLDKAKAAIDEDSAKDLSKKFLKGEFNLIDLYEQMKAVRKMGPLTKIMSMIPGMGNLNIPKDMLEQQQEKMDSWRFILDSCTKKELENPELINAQRMERIAKGSGRPLQDVRDLMKQYKQGKKVLKMFKGKDPEKMMKRFNLNPGQLKF